MFLRAQKTFSKTPRGIAIVAVLAILVILAIMASAFVMSTNTELATSKSQSFKSQSDLLADSALNHAISMISDDAESSPAWDDLKEPWASDFRALNSKTADRINVDNISNGKKSIDDSKWIYVIDKTGKMVGRYAVLIEDEASKININVASSLSTKQQNQGVSPCEILLRSNNGAGLPISLAIGKNILRYRYGRDLRPGQSSVDDNNTASTYASDLIDNNANGVIDEPNEGIDESEEYDPINLHWDDRAFSSVREAGTIASKGKPLSKSGYNILKKFATVHSQNNDTYWDSSAQICRNKINLNAVSRKQLSKILRKANKESRFESDGKNIQSLVGNLIDYRDENHVLSTMGTQYGVEAVCFNEILANDGSFTLRLDDEKTHRYGRYYYGPNDNGKYEPLYKFPRKLDPEYGWKIEKLGPLIQNKSDIYWHGGENFKVKSTATITLESKKKSEKYQKKFKDDSRNAGGWKNDQWKNSFLMVYNKTEGSGPDEIFKYYYFPIVDNSKDSLTIGTDSIEGDGGDYNILSDIVNGSSTSSNNSCRINNFWRRNNGGTVCVMPRVTERGLFPVKYHDDVKSGHESKLKKYYYKIFISEQNLPDNIMDKDSDYNNSFLFQYWFEYPLDAKVTPWKGFNEFLDVDGKPSSDSLTEMLKVNKKDLEGTTLKMQGKKKEEWLLRTPYRDGKPIRPKHGYLDVTVTTRKDTGYGEVGSKWETHFVASDQSEAGHSDHKTAYKNKNTWVGIYAMRPDIIELINISDHPISLRNWRVVINTGSYADQLGIIETSKGYTRKGGMKKGNPNPSINPGDYFYITSNNRIFDKEFGSPKDGKWGNSIGEKFQCFELPDFLWGTRYKIKRTSDGKVYCKGADWRKDQMKYEISEWLLRKSRKDQNSPFGIRSTIDGNGRSYLDFGNVTVTSVKAGDDILILGMPRSGGFLSMTLKNEYNQITARTIDYGKTKFKDVGCSTEKVDPTHYTWRKTSRPSFGGTERKARNRSVRGKSKVKPYVKDNRYVSPGEIQKVRKAEDWQNIGMEKAGGTSTRTLKSLAKYFTVSGIRLDAEETDAHVSGWKPAFGKVKFGSSGKVNAENANWEPGIWKDQTLRITSGEQKGEKFAIKNSTESAIMIAGYSLPGDKKPMVNPDDTFSVGPGYSTPFYYTRQSNEEGIWEWKNKGLKRANYGLYLFGLNDSIKTTEFFEENRNAVLEAAVFNYKTRKFDRLPLIRKTIPSKDDPYNIVSRTTRLRYDKSDSIYCGVITPDHISFNGAFKLRLIPHNLNDQDCSGFAWFDYAYLTPGFTSGKININTASERVLQALNDVTPAIAKNIRFGKLRGSKNSSVKPYKNITDILDVDGITPEIFGKIANQITARSDQFRISVIAQTLSDSNNDGKFNSDEGDEILAETRIEEIIDRTGLTDDNPETDHIKISVSN